MGFVPADPDFETRARASFAKQGAMALLGATGLQTLMTVVGRSGVKD
jgi:hypothetical protein